MNASASPDASSDDWPTQSACLAIPDTSYRAADSAAPVRACIIDLGTNSFHAIIVDAYANGSFKVVDRMKEMVRLGQHGLGKNRLPEDAMQRGLEALRRIHLLAQGWGAREYLAFATSAIREATNGGAFIDRVNDELGLRIRPISGEQEARLIYQGVRRAVDLDAPSLLVDIGGGSVEFIVSEGGEVRFARSLKLGAARMTERFVTTDPLSEAEEEAMRAHFREALQPVVEAARQYGVTTIVGSSGTNEALAQVFVNRSGDASRSIFQQDLPPKPFRKILRRVIDSTETERHAADGIEEKRVDQIAAGAVLVDTLLDTLAVERLRVSSNALREGMVVHFIDQNLRLLQRLAPFTDVRRRSVYELGFRFRWKERHAQHVAATAQFLFDACRPLYDGPRADRELLEYAALLHDVGYHISHRGHHKHSRYLIAHADLRGFQPEETALIALVARYHRGARPKKKHKRYKKRSRSERRRVRQLAALLRIAEGLDRSHFQNVRALAATLTADRLRLQLQTKGDPQLEVGTAEENSALFTRVFDRELVVTAGFEGVDPARLSKPDNGQVSSDSSVANEPVGDAAMVE
jgi:exopolyphosphatase/guanosine-5'-triphosphate,3'-diphosphate pyrophosphatase